MAQIEHSAVSLRIIGDTLMPDEISKMLGASPTYSQFMGETLIGKKTGNKRIAKFGMWQLSVADSTPENIEDQIDQLLGQLTNNLDIWSKIANQFKVDLFCGLFMAGGNEGLHLSPQILVAIGQRGIVLGLDIYGPAQD